MVTPQGILMAVVGAIACFMGYSMFRSMLPLWGFILGGYIVMVIAPNFIHLNGVAQIYVTIGSFVVGGIIGALISTPLYYVIVFLSGGILGALIGIVGGALIDMGGITNFRDIESFQNMTFTFPPQVNSMTQLVLLIVIGAIMGALAINFQKFMITASSAFMGSAAVVGGLSGVILGSFQTMGQDLVLMVTWLLLGMVGLFVQFRVLGDET